MKKNRLKKGFTLVETLVAISILSLSVVAAFTAAQSGIQSSSIARDQITAFYLAQEAMEFIRNTRDQNAVQTLGGNTTIWLTGVAADPTDPCYFGKTCIIDSPLKTVTACPAGFGSCPSLNQDPVSGLWGYTSSWPATNFKREIQLSQTSANEVLVTIRMSWTDRGVPQSFQVEGILFNR